jgi:imipenem/basic amino acid-specific outer membrane pore
VEAKYVIQSGPAKNLSLRVRDAIVASNADQRDGDLNELRVIVDYPFTLL